MGKFFTMACGLGLAAAVGLWGYGFFIIGAEKAAADEKVEDSKKELGNWAGKAADIKNPSFIKQQDKRLADLKEEKARLRQVMKARNIEIDTTLAGKELFQFRIDVTKKYEEQDALLKKNEIPLFTSEPVDRGFVRDWSTVKPTDRVRILRDLVVTTEIVKAVAAGKADVVYAVEKGDPVKTVRKVDELVSIEFEPPKAPAVSTTGAAAVPKKPYNETEVTVKFNAHYNVVLDVIRRLEASEKCLFVVRRITASRMTVFAEELTASDLKKKIYLDTPEREPPVSVDIKLGLLEFPDPPKPAPAK